MRNTDITDLYNTHLRISRKKQNKPYKLRNNFVDFEKNPVYLPLLKLKDFFDRNYVVNIEDFFIAPYEVYKEENYFDIPFYTTMNAVKVYNIFCTLKANLDPDSDIQIEAILRGVKFIKDFCIDKKLRLSEYITFKNPGDLVNTFILHLKEKNITIYNLFAFNNFDSILGKLDYEVIKFILNEQASRISYYRTKFYSSKKGRSLAITGLRIVEKEINKSLDKK